MAAELSESARRAVMKRLDELFDDCFICAHQAFTGQHTHHFYAGERCWCCGRTLEREQLKADIKEAEEFYAELKARLDERAPA